MDRATLAHRLGASDVLRDPAAMAERTQRMPASSTTPVVHVITQRIEAAASCDHQTAQRVAAALAMDESLRGTYLGQIAPQAYATRYVDTLSLVESTMDKQQKLALHEEVCRIVGSV